MTAVSRPFTFDRVVRLVITCVLAAGAIWLVGRLQSVLLPFLTAWLAAYLLEPFVQYNRRLLRMRGRLVPVFVTLLEAVLVITVLCIIFVPSVIEEANRLADLISGYAAAGSTIPFVPAEVHDLLRNYIDFDSIADVIRNQDIQTVLDASRKLVSGGIGIIAGVLSWFTALLYLIFIMLDYERLLRGFRRMVPPRHRPAVYRIATDIKDSMNHYFRGQALVAFIVGILFAIGFAIVGLPLAVVLGLFIGLLNMVPYLQLVSIIPTTLLCLVYSAGNPGSSFWEIWWACMLVYIVVQCIQDLFLTPKIMGHSMGLNPAVILLSLSVWGTLLGFIGLIIALPLTTLLLSYYDRFLSKSEEADRTDSD